MASKIREYTSEEIIVSYDVKRCIHAAECVSRLPEVFDTSKRPWVQPQAASPDKVATVVQTCPSGALHYQRLDGGPSEAIPESNTIQPEENGPLYVQGNLIIKTENGDVIKETRIALCRCGASNNKPFCDNSHQKIDFQTTERTVYPETEGIDEAQGSPLEIKPLPSGPFLLQGDFEIQDSEGQLQFRGTKKAFCRCGRSQNKPFCDGTHVKIGFSTKSDLEQG